MRLNRSLSLHIVGSVAFGFLERTLSFVFLKELLDCGVTLGTTRNMFVAYVCRRKLMLWLNGLGLLKHTVNFSTFDQFLGGRVRRRNVVSFLLLADDRRDIRGVFEAILFLLAFGRQRVRHGLESRLGLLVHGQVVVLRFRLDRIDKLH